MVKNKAEECFSEYGQLNNYHVICIVVGIVVCIGSLFALAKMLRDITPILNIVAAILILAAGCLAAYAAYFAFQRPCMKGKMMMMMIFGWYFNLNFYYFLFTLNLALGILPFHSNVFGKDNVFNAGDGPMIAVFILDIVTALNFLGAAATVARA